MTEISKNLELKNRMLIIHLKKKKRKLQDEKNPNGKDTSLHQFVKAPKRLRYFISRVL